MPRNNFLHSSCFNIPGAPEQLPGFIWFYIWFHRGLLKSPPPVPLHSFPHSCGFNISASPRLSTASCMHRIWVQYLDFRFSSQQLLAFILVSMSNFPSPTCLFLTNFLRSPGFNIYMFPRFSQHLLACILSQYLNSPHPLPAFIFGSQKFPLRLSAFFACIFMYLHFVSMSRPRLHPSSFNNFLRSSCFNIELSLSPMCPSISCVHFASYIDFPHWSLHHFLRFYCFNAGTSPAGINNSLHASCLSI